MRSIVTIKRLLARAGKGARSFGKRMKSRLLPTVSRGDGANDANGVAGHEHGDAAFVASSDPTPMQAILGKRVELETQIEVGARCGLVSDGLAFALLKNFEDELAEKRRLLTELEHLLHDGLRRLDALCPSPPVPQPAPPPEPRRRKFTKPSDWFPGGAAGFAK